MSWRVAWFLAALSLATSFMISRYQPFPGYLDSDYYFGGGIQLAAGRGFTEPYLWNYLDDPVGLPHPSHSYWMPLASLISAAGMWLLGNPTYAAGRLGFLALAALVPVATASLAYALSRRRDLCVVSGLLAVFSIYYAPFLAVPDNYGAYIVLGASFFLVLGSKREWRFLILGLVAGLMALARSDGVLWLALAWLAALHAPPPTLTNEDPDSTISTSAPSRMRFLAKIGSRIALSALGFLIIMGPWYARNLSVQGAVMAPGGERLLWLTSYDETFAYPAEKLTYERWLSQGLPSIISARLLALRWNLLNALAAQGGIFLFPFILIGAWQHRRDPRVQIGIAGWLTLFFTMTMVFPFAGWRGGFFHAGAGMQALWWSLAPVGLESVVAAARRRGLFTAQAFTIFRVGLVGLAMLLTLMTVQIRVLAGWGEGEQSYPAVEEFLVAQGARTSDVVMVRNPPGYYIMTGRPAIVVPYEDATGMLQAARRYGAAYLVLEKAGAGGPIRSIYDDLVNSDFPYLGQVNGTRIFRLSP